MHRHWGSFFTLCISCLHNLNIDLACSTWTHVLSLLHLHPSISVFLHWPSEIKDHIYCGWSIKAEAKVCLNSIHCQSSLIQLQSTFRHNLNRWPALSPIMLECQMLSFMVQPHDPTLWIKLWCCWTPGSWPQSSEPFLAKDRRIVCSLVIQCCTIMHVDFSELTDDRSLDFSLWISPSLGEIPELVVHL